MPISHNKVKFESVWIMTLKEIRFIVWGHFYQRLLQRGMQLNKIIWFRRVISNSNHIAIREIVA